MLNKFLSLFTSKKKRFKKDVHRQRSRIYLHKEQYKKTSTHTRSHKSKKFLFHIFVPRYWLIFLYLLGLVLTLSGITYLVKGSFFDIENIELYSGDTYSDTNIGYKALESIRWKNIFLTQKHALTSQLKSYQKNISHANIKKSFPNTVILELYSYPLVAKLLFPNKKEFFLSENWVLLPTKDSKKEQSHEIPEILIASSEEIFRQARTYELFFQRNELSKILFLIKDLSNSTQKQNIKWYTFYVKEKELHVETNNNTRLIFNIERGIKEQLSKFSLYSKDSKELKHIYIDFRVQGKVFECPYEQKTLCNNNLVYIYEDNS